MIVLAVVTDAVDVGGFCWRIVSAGELCRRPVIKRPSGWRWDLWCKEPRVSSVHVAAAASATDQSDCFRQKPAQSGCRSVCCAAQCVAFVHSRGQRCSAHHYLLIHMSSCDSPKPDRSGLKAFVWSKWDLWRLIGIFVKSRIMCLAVFELS